VADRDPSDLSNAPSDEDLIAGAKRGQVRAFEALLDRHQAKVLRIARLLGVTATDRDDVAQDVFVRVFRHLDGFRPGGDFSGWIYRVTVNVVHDHRKRARRTAWREGALDDAPEPAVETGAADPHRMVESRDLARELEAALADLSERERAVFVLRELEGLETAAVARALGVTRITVRRHLGLARRRLRALLSVHEKKSRSD
jgi:RNA polymerase sigma-70 factor (ECF subfamily)